MNDNPYRKTISSKQKSFMIILSIFLIGIVVSQVISHVGIYFLQQTVEDLQITLTAIQQRRFIFGYRLLMSILCINICLLLSLLFIYFSIYRKTKSSFILGLNFFIGVLLTKSLFSVLYLFTFFNESIKNLPNTVNIFSTSGFGVLGFFINIFEIIAISILLYLALE
jgi:hypothetical protein